MQKKYMKLFSLITRIFRLSVWRLCALPLLVVAGAATASASSLPLFSDALAQARANADGSTWRIEPGRYSAGNGPVLLRGIRDVTIIAEGVTLVSENITSSALRLEDCQNITFQGLTVDYDPLPFTQGRVTAVNRAEGTVEFALDDGYPDLAGEYLVRRMLLFNADGSAWKQGAPDFYPQQIEALSLRQGRFTFPKNLAGLQFVEVGDRLAINVRRNSAIQVMNLSSDIHWVDCTVHAAPGLAFIVRFAESAGTYNNVRIVRGPTPAGATQGRLLSANADGMNIAYTRTGPVIENCEFAWMGDDSINLHGVTLPVLEWVDERTYLTMRPVGGEMYDWLLRQGDTVRFLKPDTYEQITLGEVESCVEVSENKEDWAELARTIWPSFSSQSRADFYHVTLAEPVSGVAVGDFTTIPQTGAMGYRIENNYFHDHRARALRLMTEEGIVRGNRIERTLGVAISVGSELHYWRESGYARNIVIENNTLKDVAYGANTAAASSYTLGAISIYTQVKPQGKDTRFYPGNENIRITGNTVDGSGVAGIQVVGAASVLIENNVLERTNQNITARSGQDYGLNITGPIVVTESVDVTVGDNVTDFPVTEPATHTLGNALLTHAPQGITAVAVYEGQSAGGEQSAGEGFRFFHTEEGRRDLGQAFTLSAPATIGALYLPIKSAAQQQDSQANVRLSIYKLSGGKPGELVASFTGPLMPDGSRLRSGTWLELVFEPVSLPAGSYAFVIGFAGGAAAGQSVVLTIDNAATGAAASSGLYTTDGQGTQFRACKPFVFTLAEAVAPAQAGRVLRVDARGGAEFASLSAAAQVARAGDTIEIAPGSGPYREAFYIRASGTQEQPIVVEGNGELVTGFEPLTGFVQEQGRWVVDLGERFPAVLTYRGERLLQSAVSGQFHDYATLDAGEGGSRLILNEGVEPQGWEISTRYFVVRIENVSWHTYRNLRASGAQNDGFNLHGTGSGLVFENIEGFHNLDEGYSAHDKIDSRIDGGLFWGNDNGLFNIGESRLSGGDIVCRDNLGWGLAFKDCHAVLSNVTLEGNGVSELHLSGSAVVSLSGLQLTPGQQSVPQWVRYKESRNATVYTAQVIGSGVTYVAPASL